MSYYDYADEYFALHLERDIDADEAGRYAEISLMFENVSEGALDEENHQIAA